jgi:hypothetical protein
MEDLSGMELTTAALNTILVSVRMERWLSGLNVEACLAKQDGLASSSKEWAILEKNEFGRCLDIEKVVKKNIRESFEVEDDDDRDGKRGNGDDDSHSDDKGNGI